MTPPKPEYDPAYLAKKEQLPDAVRLELGLIEERIIADPTREFQRRYLADGIVADASGYDEFGIEVTYKDLGDVFRFVGFTIEPDK